MTHPLIVAVGGSRDFGHGDPQLAQLVFDIIDTFPPGTIIFSGAARGPDRWAIEAARHFGLPCREYHADWRTHARGAGMIRTKNMLQEIARLPNPKRVILFWDGKSTGTRFTINHARDLGLPVTVILEDEARHFVMTRMTHSI